MINLKDLKAELNVLINHKISFVRVAGNTIFIYFFGKPGSKRVISLQIEPIWRLERDKKVDVTSRDLYYFKDEEKYSEYEKRFKTMCSYCMLIKDANLVEYKIDRVSNDIILYFSNNVVIKNFSSSVNDVFWMLRNRQKELRIDISSSKIELKRIKPKNK